MHFNVCDTFNSQLFHQYVTAGIPAICRVKLLQENKRKNVVKCVIIPL